MAKKAPAKPAAKRRSLNTIVDAAPQIAELAKRMEAERARIIAEMAAEEKAKKAPVQPAVVVTTESIAWRPWLRSGAKAAAWIVCGAVAGIYAAGGIEVGPGPIVRNDVLQQSYDADRTTQAAVLRELSEQDFDGSTDEGRRKAGEWFNAQRFRNRAVDHRPYTDAVAEAIAADKVGWMADELEGK